MIMSYSEYGKRCGLCWKYRESRMYFLPINGKYRKLCKECWESLNNQKNLPVVMSPTNDILYKE